MVINAWSEPIYLPQEGEVKREWTYKEPFLDWDMDLNDYAEFLDYVYKKEHGSDSDLDHPNKKYFDEFLEDHPIKFDKRDLKKGEAPSYKQLVHWSGGMNCKSDVKYTWDEIRSAKRRDDKRLIHENVQSIKVKNSIKIANAAIENINDTYALKKMLKASGKLSLSQDKAGSESVLANLQIIDNLGSENPNEFKADINFQGEVKSENKTTIEQTFDELYDGELYDTLIDETQKLCQIQNEDEK